jgi:hypothetical protein
MLPLQSAAQYPLGRLPEAWHLGDMPIPSIPPPPPMDVHPGQRFSLCGEALAPALSALNTEARDAGWHEREVVVAVMTWAATRAAMIDGGEATTDALMLALDAARGQGG